MGEAHSQLQAPTDDTSAAATVAAAAATQQGGHLSSQVAGVANAVFNSSRHSLMDGGSVAGGLGQLQSTPGYSQLCEPVLLSQLVQLLSQRPNHMLLLSDLGALLPGPFRTGVKERGGLRSWLHKYQELFKVSGQPGKECVTLLLGSGMELNAGNSLAQKSQPTTRSANEYKEEHEQSSQRENVDDNESDIQLRGLPYRASVADVRAFLGHHVQFLRDDRSVRLVLNRDGRASGFAHVQFASPAYAKAARDDLHMRVMDTARSQADGGAERYVEVFLFSERPNKLRFRKNTTGDEWSSSTPAPQELGCTEWTAGIAQDRVIAECRDHMASPGKGQVLLSMLGVALSPSSRLFLKKNDQGLKHFLSQYPHEFRVEGAKGREYIIYIPACGGGGANEQGNSDFPIPFTQDNHSNLPFGFAVGFTNGYTEDFSQQSRVSHTTSSCIRAGDLLGVASHPKGMEMLPSALFHGGGGSDEGALAAVQSPMSSGGHLAFDETPKNLTTPSCWGTPSNWGTPQIFSSMHGGSGGVHNHQDANLEDADVSHAPGPHRSQDRFGADGVTGYGAAGTKPGPESMGWSTWQMPILQWPNGSVSGCDGLPGTMDCSFAQHHPTWPASGHQQDGHVMPNFASVFATLGGHHVSVNNTSVPQQPSSEQVQCPTENSVRLRGLPFTATEQDVLALFAKHELIECIADVPKPVTMVSKSTGKPSGQAVVQLVSPTDVGLVQRTIHGQYMGNRYVEVFPRSENEHNAPGHFPRPHASTSAAVGGGILPSGPETFSLQAALAPTTGLADLKNSPPADSSPSRKALSNLLLPQQMPGDVLLGVGDAGGPGSYAGAAAPWPQQHYWEAVHPVWAA